MIHPRSECLSSCTHDLPRPVPRVEDPAALAAVHCGPPTFYPAEAVVPPVYAGIPDGAASALSFTRVDQAEQLALFPEPELISHNPWPEEVAVPVAVVRIRRQAEAAGCLVRVQYSRGHGTHATHGRPTSLCHWVGVRLRRPDGAPAYAIYVRAVHGAGPWKWQSIRTPDRKLTLTELTEWITGSLPSLTIT